MAPRPRVLTPHLLQDPCSCNSKSFVTTNHLPPQDPIDALANHPTSPMGHTTQGCFSNQKLKNWSTASDISTLLNCVAKARLLELVCVLVFIAVKWEFH